MSNSPANDLTLDKDIACNPDKKPKTTMKIYFHSFIGIALMLLFPMLPPFEPMTPLGMKLVGIFMGMVYLWSTVSSIWPSALGILLMGMSGYEGEGYMGVKTTMLNAFGSDAVVLIVFAMVLFGALDHAGCTQYIARWFLTRKVINGRPYVFMGIFFFTSYVLSALTSPMTALIILWPISTDLMAELKIERCEKFWPVFLVGTFFAATIGQPFLPFLGAQLVVLSAFNKVVGMDVNYVAYMSFNFIMSVFLMLAFLVLIKFLFRPDVSKVKNINVDQINANPLPPMNGLQKAYLIMIPLYVFMMLAPTLLPATVPGVALCATMGPLGVTVFWLAIFSVVQYKGETALPFTPVANTKFSWDVYFLVAAAVYAANAVSSDVTGVKPFLIELLNPILGNKPEMVFVAILFTVALILTNFANNAAMAVILLPVIAAFSEQMGISPVPVCMGVTMMVFVAMLTPAASPHAGMMHGRKDLYASKDILSIGFPLCVLALVSYIFIGYPLAKILFV